MPHNDIEMLLTKNATVWGNYAEHFALQPVSMLTLGVL